MPLRLRYRQLSDALTVVARQLGSSAEQVRMSVSRHFVAIVLAIALSGGGGTGAVAGGRDTHLTATYILALMAGFSPEDARLIALADHSLDLNPNTDAKHQVEDWKGAQPVPNRHYENGTLYHSLCTSAAECEARLQAMRNGINLEIQRQRRSDENRRKLLAMIGQYLHATQDVYFHQHVDPKTGKIVPYESGVGHLHPGDRQSLGGDEDSVARQRGVPSQRANQHGFEILRQFNESGTLPPVRSADQMYSTITSAETESIKSSGVDKLTDALVKSVNATTEDARKNLTGAFRDIMGPNAKLDLPDYMFDMEYGSPNAKKYALKYDRDDADLIAWPKPGWTPPSASERQAAFAASLEQAYDELYRDVPDRLRPILPRPRLELGFFDAIEDAKAGMRGLLNVPHDLLSLDYWKYMAQYYGLYDATSPRYKLTRPPAGQPWKSEVVDTGATSGCPPECKPRSDRRESTITSRDWGDASPDRRAANDDAMIDPRTGEIYNQWRSDGQLGNLSGFGPAVQTPTIEIFIEEWMKGRNKVGSPPPDYSGVSRPPERTARVPAGRASERPNSTITGTDCIDACTGANASAKACESCRANGGKTSKAQLKPPEMPSCSKSSGQICGTQSTSQGVRTFWCCAPWQCNPGNLEKCSPPAQ